MDPAAVQPVSAATAAAATVAAATAAAAAPADTAAHAQAEAGHGTERGASRMQVDLPAAQPAKRGGGGSGRRGARRSAPAGAAQEPEEMVRLGPEVARNSERLRTGWHPVQLSAEDKAAEVDLDDAQLSCSSRAGYRMVRATHGACSGTWYYEVRIDRLGPSGAARVGWSTRQAELNAPVGADENGFSYRSLNGSKVHKGWRDEYGEAYGEGDVVGCLLHLPEGGRPFEQGAADVVKYKGKLYFEEGEPAEPQPLAGAFVAFARNGVLQGKAYTDIREGTYYPAVSLYTNRGQQHEAAAATVNFGELGFAFPPPQAEGCPAPSPACEVSGPRPSAAARQQQQIPAEAAAQQVRTAPLPQQQQQGVAVMAVDPHGGQGPGSHMQCFNSAPPLAVQQLTGGQAREDHAGAGSADAMDAD